jgi:hypothetical protein
MTHDDLQFHLARDAGLRLLRSDNAPLVLSFLYGQYKAQPRVAIGHEELLERLENVLIDIRSRQPDAYPAAAQVYLSRWCDEQHAYLRKYFEGGSDEPVYELTPATERALRWLEDLQRIEFVGTESRFLQIFDLLEEIVRKSTEDPELRLAQLEKEMAALEREIGEIRKTGRVERYSSTQVKERFIKANEEARRLVGDFREVEANFREVTRRMQERRLLEDATKGDVVGYVIDADDALKESDQGRSFYAFWRFLISREKKDELRALLEHVYSMPDLLSLEGDYSMLRNVVRHLSEAGEKVVQSNRRLAEQLRRMLEEAHLRENRRVMDLVGEIKKAALAVKADPPADRAVAELEGPPNVDLPMERPLWQSDEKPSFEHQPTEPDAISLGDINLSGLFDFFAVEREQLEMRIGEALAHRRQATLRDILDQYPVQKGLTELLVYMVIATDDERHIVDESVKEEITVYRGDRPPRCVAMPRIIFVR